MIQPKWHAPSLANNVDLWHFSKTSGVFYCFLLWALLIGLDEWKIFEILEQWPTSASMCGGNLYAQLDDRVLWNLGLGKDGSLDIRKGLTSM